MPHAAVLYICKANPGQLRRCLSGYLRHGRGGRARHWGGRLIWQLADAADQLVRWRETTDLTTTPISEEATMIAAFRDAHGKPPFANKPNRLGR